MVDFENFQKARLIPITGIKGAQDQERRATSALLAVMRAVPSFAQTLLKPFGAPKGQVETFIEPEFKVGTQKIRPDGLIVVTRGNKTWTALVEVKTGKNPLELNQLHSYLDICRDYGFDALITLSNEVLNASGDHPTAGIDQRKLRSIKLGHYSWVKLITEAIILTEHDGLADVEQDFVLTELIRFLQSEASGASEFNDMGPAWASVRNGIKNGSLRKPDADVEQIVLNFQALVRYSALTLAARLGVGAREVVPRMARKDPKKYLGAQLKQLVDGKTLSGSIHIPDAAADLELEADLAAGVLRCGFSVDAPADGRNKTRINWVLRQLKNAPPRTFLSWSYRHARSPEMAHRINDLNDEDYSYDLSKEREISSFRIEVVFNMGLKRLGGKGGFIDSVVDAYETVYGELLQPFKSWKRRAPKLSEKVTEIIPEQDPVSPRGW